LLNDIEQLLHKIKAKRRREMGVEIYSDAAFMSWRVQLRLRGPCNQRFSYLPKFCPWTVDRPLVLDYRRTVFIRLGTGTVQRTYSNNLPERYRYL
jgi:hypothetical protein